MRSMKTALLFLFAALTLLQAQEALDRAQRLIYAKAGEPLQIVYKMKRGQLSQRDLRRGNVRVLIYWQPGMTPDTLQLKQNEKGRFLGTVHIPERGLQTFSFVMQYHDTTDNRSRTLNARDELGTDVLLTEVNAQPVASAYLQMGLAWAAGQDWRETDPDLARKAYLKEVELYPKNFRARQTLYTQLFEGGSRKTKQMIREDIEDALQQYNSAEALEFAIQAYGLLSDLERVAELQADLMMRFPQSVPASQLKLRQIMARENLEDRVAKLSDFVYSRPPQEVMETALGQWISALVTLERTQDGLTVGDLLMEESRSPRAASALAALAGALAEEGRWMEHAETYARKAVALMEEQKTPLDSDPVGHAEWRQTLARYYDVLGWVLFKQQRLEDAGEALRHATELGSQPGYYYHLGTVLNALNHHQDALVQIGRAAAFEGGIGDLAYNRLYEIFSTTGRDTLEIPALVAQQSLWVENRFISDVLSRRQNRIAPNFDLPDLKQAWVQLSDQRGSVVVLSFWATWSKASLRVMGALHRLSAEWGDEVLFLTVATDKSPRSVLNFARRKKLKLPVLLDDVAGKRFGIEGVPMTYIIDTEGRIHFSHRGYRPNLFEVIDIELADLLNATE